MVRLMYQFIFQGKKGIIFTLILALELLMIYLSQKQTDPYFEQMLFKDYYVLLRTNQLTQVIRIICPLILIVLFLDYDHPFYLNFYSYIGRQQVYFKKICVHLMIIFMNYVLCFSWYVIINLLTYQDPLSLKIFIGGLIDSVIIAFIIMMTMNHRTKSISLIFYVLYFVVDMIQSDYAYPLLFYMLPTGSTYFNRYPYTYHYIMLYLILCVLILNYKIRLKQFK